MGEVLVAPTSEHRLFVGARPRCRARFDVVRFPDTLQERVAFETVVRAELSTRNRFLPPDLVSVALRPHVAELAKWLKTVMAYDFEPEQMDTVLARKIGGGSRPLPYMSLRDRLAYRALVGTVDPEMESARGDHASFQVAALQVKGCKYVLKADVAAFYQYVDHERLVDEVVAQTGDDLGIVAATQLIQASTGRLFGLPQMSQASDALAEIYVDPIRRDLVRAGYAVFRFADDFRVACADYSSTLAALELMERSAFSLGLVLNESKTSTPSIDTYSSSLREIERAEGELFRTMDRTNAEILGVEVEELSTPIEDFFNVDADVYTDLEIDWGDEDLGVVRVDHADEADDEDPDVTKADEPNDPEVPSDRQVEAAKFVLTLWHERTAQDIDEKTAEVEWSNAAWSTLLRKALKVLASVGDDAVLEHVTALLVYEPHLTPQLCGYLSVLASIDEKGVAKALDEVCSRKVVSVWQALWVANCCGDLPSRGRQAAIHIVWLHDQLASEHQSVAVEAAMSLARRRLLDPDDALRIYNRVAAVHRPRAFIAMAAASGRARRELAPHDQIEGWLGAWATGEPWGRPVRTLRRAKPTPKGAG